MFNKNFFADMRRVGMGVGVSKAKLSQAMLEILEQLPSGTTSLKETIVNHLGLLGQMSATRDINEAWNQAKKKAAKKHPNKFMLDGRDALRWNVGVSKMLDKKISGPNFKRLNELADSEDCTVDRLVSKLIRCYTTKQKGKLHPISGMSSANTEHSA